MWPIRTALAGLLLLLAVLGACNAVPREGYGPGRQDWGFVDVRAGAHMFWWLYYTTAVEDYTERPLILWLHGGPGASSMYANFEELGPMTLEGGPRSHTWVKNYNVLFVENPVGTGFSYVDDDSLLATDNAEIAADLITFTKAFYEANPEFKRTPLHIYGLSYAGKMAPEFAYELNKVIQNGELDITLESVGIIAPWVSPTDTLQSYASYLLNMGFVDTEGYKHFKESTDIAVELLKQERFLEAREQMRNTTSYISEIGIDLYNVLTLQPFQPQSMNSVLRHIKQATLDTITLSDFEDRDQLLQDVMRIKVHPALELPAESIFHFQSMPVYDSLAEDFIKPAKHIIELLLNTTSLDVVVVSGQLDLIVANHGTFRWIENLQWEGRNDYLNAARNPIGPYGVLEGYEKFFGRLYVYWALRAGHMVALDNPSVMDYVLQKQTGFPETLVPYNLTRMKNTEAFY